MPGPGTTRKTRAANDRWFAAGSSAACSALALAPYREPMRGSELRTKSIGRRTGIAWQDRFASAAQASSPWRSIYLAIACGFAALVEAVTGMVLLQSDCPRCQRLMSYCILAASSGGILRFSVLITVDAPAGLKSMM